MFARVNAQYLTRVSFYFIFPLKIIFMKFKASLIFAFCLITILTSSLFVEDDQKSSVQTSELNVETDGKSYESELVLK